MICVKQDNKNIFQICINLNDNIKSLKEFRERLLKLNPSYQYHYIDSEDLFNEIMIKDFKNSKDSFEHKIYECFYSVGNILRLGEKVKKCTDKNRANEIQNICTLVSKTDIFRLAVLYKYGGFYLDLSKSFELDIDKELSIYDIALIRSHREIHTSMIYAKKNNPIIKNFLETVIENCLNKKFKISQMHLAGPGMYTKTIKKMFSEFELTSLNNFYLTPYNGVILYNEYPIRYVKFNTPWKQQLHMPDPNNGRIKPNEHWLNPKF